MNDKPDYFALFSLPAQFPIDRETLDRNFRRLQQTVHPDRFAGASDQERRLAMQQAAEINEAYRILKDPLARGRYLLELRGHPLAEEQATHQDPAFLMQQMELRESLEAVSSAGDPLGALQALISEIENQYHTLTEALAAALAADDREQAVVTLQRMQFFQKLLAETEELEADLDDF